MEITDNSYSNDNSAKEIQDVLGKSIFDYVKPTSMINLFMRTVTDHDSIILDFFSGSATTAHAVMQLNAADGGHRKFIMVQLPEETDKDSEAYRAGYKNICEIGKERIRRAGAKIKSETGADIDYGSPMILERLIGFLVKPGDIVMDFFSGSATTAEAVMRLNSKRNLNVRYIMVQLPENLDESLKLADNRAKKTIKNAIKFLDSIHKEHNICEIGKERIRRAGAKIKTETDADIDYGCLTAELRQKPKYE